MDGRGTYSQRTRLKPSTVKQTEELREIPGKRGRDVKNRGESRKRLTGNKEIESCDRIKTEKEKR